MSLSPTWSHSPHGKANVRRIEGRAIPRPHDTASGKPGDELARRVVLCLVVADAIRRCQLERLVIIDPE